VLIDDYPDVLPLVTAVPRLRTWLPLRMGPHVEARQLSSLKRNGYFERPPHRSVIYADVVTTL
jgi:hypothetical protein